MLVHARALLTSAPGGMTSYIEADVRDTEEILGEAAGTLDFSQPIALMMLGIMGQLPDSAGPRSIVTTLLDALPPGSYLALSDGTDTSPALNQAIAAYNQNSASSYHLRSPEEIARFFDGLTLVPAGRGYRLPGGGPTWLTPARSPGRSTRSAAWDARTDA